MKNSKSGKRSRLKAEWLKEGNDMIESPTTIFNRVEEERQIPLQWRGSAIRSLCKGDGSKKKNQENQRGTFIRYNSNDIKSRERTEETGQKRREK